MASGEHSARSRAVIRPKSSDIDESSWFGHLAFVHSNLFVIWCLVIGHSRLQTRKFLIRSRVSRITSRMNRPAKLALFVLTIVGIVLTGCSSSSRPRTYPVTGTVTSQGKPLAGAAITFVPTGDDAEAASAITDANGKYALTTWKAGDGARPGEYRVKVSKQAQTTVDPSKMVKNLTIEEEQKIYVESKNPPPPAKSLIPAKYQDDQTSGLIHKVEQKPTTFDIKLD